MVQHINFDDVQLRNGHASYHIPRSSTPAVGTTVTALALWAAWAISLDSHTETEDVTFSISFPKVPKKNFPLRVLVSPDLTVSGFLDSVHAQYLETFPQCTLDRFSIKTAYTHEGSHVGIQSLHLPVQESETWAEQDTDVNAGNREPNYSAGRTALELEFEIDQDGIEIRTAPDTVLIVDAKIRQMICPLEHILPQLLSDKHTDTNLSDLELILPSDIQDIRSYRHPSIPNLDTCAHRLIENWTKRQPDAVAIYTSDAHITYGELGDLSTRLAHYLRSLDVGPEVLVPFCFEKSPWAIISVLAILKAGGACVGLDPNHPMPRLEEIIHQCDAKIVLTSASFSEKLSNIRAISVPVDDALLKTLPTISLSPCTSVNSGNPAYATFTSGSTGRPKGIVVEHKALCASAQSQHETLRLSSASRVLQFAAYSFDISNGDIFNTLMNGGCICVPSEEERSNSLTEYIARAEVNWACLTPSVAGLLNPLDVPTLETLVLCGEPIPQATVQTWAPAVYLVDAYGPAETTILCTSNPGVSPSTNSANLGYDMGATTWIVNPVNHDQLRPLSCIGEILIEGPLVARGYLNDPKTTAASFIQSPLWARRMAPNEPFRRFYKSGDLGFLNPDGSITFAGRKDRQVKVRGQRLELHEVEHHLRNALPTTVTNVAADVVSVETHSVLVAFLCLDNRSEHSIDLTSIDGPTRHTLEEAIESIQANLADVLPTYMIPSAYLPMITLPLTRNGKVDRHKLKSLVSGISLEQLTAPMGRSTGTTPTTALESRIRALWAQVLGVDERTIKREDHFIKLGGDSLRAMKLVAACRADGIPLTMATVFHATSLEDMAFMCDPDEQPEAERNDDEVEPYALLDGMTSINALQEAAVAQFAGITKDSIEDIYPCTPLQEGVMALSLKQHGSYVAQDVTELPQSIDLPRFRAAWSTTVENCHVLRTRLLQSQAVGTMQVVLRNAGSWHDGAVEDASAFDEYLEKERNTVLELGQPLSRFSLVIDVSTQTRHFIWTAHHAVYDGWSMPLIKDMVEAAYSGKVVLKPTPFNRFIREALWQTDRSRGDFWRSYFQDYQSPSFPRLPSPTYQPHARSMLDHAFNVQPQSGTGYTLPTVLRAAWAVLIGRYIDSTDVCFAATLAGRNFSIPKIDTVIGPTFATVPIRVHWDNSQTIEDLLRHVQLHSVKMIPFEQTGLQNIQRVSEEARQACELQSLLVIQLPLEERRYNVFAGNKIFGGELVDYGSYAIMLQCMLRENAVTIRMTYDANAVKPEQAQRYMNQFEHVVHQLLSCDSSLKVEHLEIISAADKAEITLWNGTPFRSVDSCVHTVFASQVAIRPNAQAVSSWDGTLTYAELDDVSTRLAHHIATFLRSDRENFVPLCFQKSTWAIVAVMATLKAGAAFVPLDPLHPSSRLQSIVGEVHADLVLCSGPYNALFASVCHNVFTVDATLIGSLTPPGQDRVSLPCSSTQTPLYLIFTSGSTGKPKGVLTEHGAFVSSATAYGEGMHMSSDRRVLLYSSYSFDNSVLEILTPLIFGACVCIISDKERLDNLGPAMARLAVDWALLTPTVARDVDPKSVPSLEVLLLGGEAVEAVDVAQWAPFIRHLIISYGPTEASVISGAFVGVHSNTDPRNIGRPFNASYWVTSHHDHNKLLPIGAVGELLIEGPILARGYLSAELTAKAFIKDPTWARDVQKEKSDEPIGVESRQRRFYKTGDLVYYDNDGNVIYVDRSDTQVKLRGHRIELGEVEYHILRLLPNIKTVRVDVIDTGTESHHAMLVAFICLPDVPQNGLVHGFLAADPTTRGRLLSAVDAIRSDLLTVLPRYMIPSLFLPLQQLPSTVSRKTDRKQLSSMVRSMTPDEIALYQRTAARGREPSTAMETQLQQLWASVLHVPPSGLSAEDSFFAVGGDSVLAIRLTAACRLEGLSLSVPQIFQTPKLSEMAALFSGSDLSLVSLVPAFDLIEESDVKDLCAQAAAHCGLSNDMIQDIYPCTPMQEALFTSSTKSPGAYIARFLLKLPMDVDLAKFRLAVESAVETTPILRTRIFQSGPQRLLQVVLQSVDLKWQVFDDLETATQEDVGVAFAIGRPMAQYTLVNGSSTRPPYFMWNIHHILYDGWSMTSMRQRIDQNYRAVNGVPAARSHFNRFVKHVNKVDNQAATHFWREYLACAVGPSFPRVEARENVRATQILESRLSLAARRCSNTFTLPTILRAAWGLLVQCYSGSSDVVFGATLSGRDISLGGVDEIIGPTIATVPIRIRLNDSAVSVASFLQEVQDDVTRMIPYQHLGIHIIQRVSTEASAACQFRSQLVVQPTEKESSGICSSWSDAKEDLHRFNSYALMIECSLREQPGGLFEALLIASYDPDVLDSTEIKRAVQQYGHVVNSLISADDRDSMSTINMISEQDQEQLDAWNDLGRLRQRDECLHKVFEQNARSAPDCMAVSAWDGEMTYKDLNEASERLCSLLLSKGVKRGSPVALLFERSKWMCAAALATFKAGGTIVPLEHKHPASHLEAIIVRAKAGILLTCRSLAGLLITSAETLFIDDQAIDGMRPAEGTNTSEPARPQDPAVMIFTSESTTAPKGIILEHKALCSNALAFGKAMLFDRHTRTVQLASHASDSMLVEILVPLLFGGCTCVPKEYRDLPSTGEIMTQMSVNWALLTPSVARLINPDDVPQLATLVLGGEAPSSADVMRWHGHVKHLINGYHLGECSIFPSAYIGLNPGVDRANIGSPFNAHYWITLPGDVQRLCPIGGIGELLVDGPILARGYLDAPELTADTFIDSPRWADTRPQSRMYRTGDLVRYHTDGTLSYIGQADRQGKPRDQRIQLAEVEHQLLRASPSLKDAAVEMIQLEGSLAETFLVAFLSLGSQGHNDGGQVVDGKSDQLVSRHVDGIDDTVRRVLASSMLPSHYIPFTTFPLTRSFRTDRRKLRRYASRLSVEGLNAFASQSEGKRHSPHTPMEIMLQRHWAATFRRDPQKIGSNDHFFRLGGDSLAAMHLVHRLRKDGHSLTVTDVFQKPLLADMAHALKPAPAPVLGQDPDAFSLLPDCDADRSLRQEISSQYQIPQDLIEDMYPSTKLQEGFMALSVKQIGSYVARFFMDLSTANIDVERFVAAWEQVFARTPVLRTRICDTKSHGSIQVVLVESIDWIVSDDLDQYLTQDRASVVNQGSRLARFALIRTSTHRYFVWTIHHALYDAWSLQAILRNLNDVYAGKPPSPVAGFNRFIRHMLQSNRASSPTVEGFWRLQLADAPVSDFPALPSTIYEPRPDSILTRAFNSPARQSSVCTMSTLVWAAWALVLSRYTGTTDVVFGAVLSGRDAPVQDIEEVQGPTINTVPIRHRLNHNLTVQQFLEGFQEQATSMIPFASCGLHQIQRLSSDTSTACQFRTLLTVQPLADEGTEDTIALHAIGNEGEFTSYPLTLDCSFSKTHLKITAAYDSKVADERHMLRIVHQFNHAIVQLCSEESHYIHALEPLSSADVREIAQWNNHNPRPADTYIDEIFRQSASLHADAVAIHAWDGQLTFRELDVLSTSLASHLVQLGVRPDTMVPLCFPKSMWFVVAILAVFKAGGTIVPMDPAQPFIRLSNIIKQSDAQTILCSTEYSNWFDPLCENVICVNSKSRWRSASLETIGGTHDSPQDAAYIIFTSGSTGEPKGCVVTHEAYCSHLSSVVKEYVNSNTRSLQFASYSFDACLLDIIPALAAGGCVCIPTDCSRLDDISGVISQMAVNTVFVTPSMSRLINPSEVPTLKTIYIGGEALSQDDVSRWMGHAELTQVYGPTECAVLCSRIKMTDDTHPNNIGRAYQGSFWIVDPSNHNILLPIGAVGELLVDGPFVGRGYLHDDTKTAESFIKNPHWLPVHQRPRRMYKTGDLVRYNSDGTVNFVGRKDTQIKLRGIRIQLDEVEFHLRKTFPGIEGVAAEIVEVGSRTMLVAFFSCEDNTMGSDDTKRHWTDQSLLDVKKSAKDELASNLTRSEDKLADTMPRSMIPSAYIPIQRMPTTITGKTDRVRLRRLMSAMSIKDFEATKLQDSQPRIQPSGVIEKTLQGLWSSLLSIEAGNISAGDSFFRLGGDSILAIRLVTVCRRQGIFLSAADIFQTPRLCDMALASREALVDTEDEILPFSLLGGSSSVESIKTHFAAACGVKEDMIEDIYPCAALQEGLMAISIKKPGAYMARGWIELLDTVDVQRFQSAWEKTSTAYQILRTRIAPNLFNGFSQVVLNEPIQWRHGTSLDGYLEQDSGQPMSFGGPLTRYAIIRDVGSRCVYFAWTIHHALYDGWSMSQTLKAVDEAYKNEGLEKKPAAFNRYIAYLTRDGGAQAAELYWRSTLQDATPSAFPQPPTATLQQQPELGLRHVINVSKRKSVNSDFTLSNIIRAAWAVLVSRYTDSLDIVFGTVLAGRNAPVHGIEEIVGPTISTVPIRVIIDPCKSVSDYLRQVQNQATEMIPYETLGLQNMQRINAAAHAACQFQSLLVVQPNVAVDTDSVCPIQMNVSSEILNNVGPYTLAMDCSINDYGVEIEAGFDASVISHQQMRRVLRQFDYLVQQICEADESLLVRDLDMVTVSDRQEIEHWFGSEIEVATACADQMFEDNVQRSRDRSAIEGWDGNFTYEELNKAVNRLTPSLIAAGVGPETKVPFCFQKSRWAVVAMLAVVKAGGTLVPLDPAHPRARLGLIIRAVEATVVLCSSDQAEWLSVYCGHVIVVDTSVDDLPTPPNSTFHRTSLSSGLYIVYTSGSAGEPKGCVVEHRAFCSSVRQHRKSGVFTYSIRTLQLASYSFGAAVIEILSTLINGGCLCIVPNEARSNIASVVKQMGVNSMFLSPTFARLLSPQAVPTVKTLVLGAEAMNTGDIEKWSPHVILMQGYGQTECTNIAALQPQMIPGVDPRSVGFGVAARFWVVDPSDHDLLAPLGAVGELLIEGPILARGYLNDQAKTQASFVKPPKWRESFAFDHYARLYKTGDLARLHDDGSLLLFGRKDTQVKLRGQRIELGEIEYHIRRLTPGAKGVVVEMVKPSVEDGDSHAALVAFLCLGPDRIHNSDLAARDPETRNALLPLVAGLAGQLSDVLPSYMMVSAFLPVPAFPTTTTGKIDRKLLRAQASALSVEDLAFYGLSQMARREASTPMEKHLQSLWATVMGTDKELIGLDDTFLQLGGDSIVAIKLVSACRSEGLSLSVADIFTNPSLVKMAEVVQPIISGQSTHTPMSSVDDLSREELLRELIDQGTIEEGDDIEDVLDTTYMQDRFVACGVMERRSKTNYVSLDFTASMDATRLEAACRKLVNHHPILRTVFVPHRRQLLQVVLQTFPGGFQHYHCGKDFKNFAAHIIDADQAEKASFGQSFVRFMFFDGGIHGFRFTVRINHAQFDGMSMPVLLHDLAAVFKDQDYVLRSPSFSDFIYHARATHDAGAVNFYSGLLSGAAMTEIAAQPSASSYNNLIDRVNRHTVPHVMHVQHGVTFPSILKAAWAMVLSEVTGKKDVVFGYLVSGRNTTLPNIEQVAGPCINITPVRVQRQSDSAVDLLAQVRDQSLAAIPYETFSFAKIVARCTPWPKWTRCSTIVQCHHIPIREGSVPFGDNECSLTLNDPPSDLADLLIDAMPSGVGDEKMIITFHFNTNRVSPELVDRMAASLCSHIERLGGDVDAMVLPSIPEGAALQLPSHVPVPDVGAEKDDDCIDPIVRQVWDKVFGEQSKESGKARTPFYDIWPSPTAAVYLVECYKEKEVDIKMEEAYEYPTMRLQSQLLRGKKI